MKRTFFIILSIAILLSLMACAAPTVDTVPSEAKTNEAAAPTTTVSTPSPPPKPTPGPEPTPEPVIDPESFLGEQYNPLYNIKWPDSYQAT